MKDLELNKIPKFDFPSDKKEQGSKIVLHTGIFDRFFPTRVLSMSKVLILEYCI